MQVWLLRNPEKQEIPLRKGKKQMPYEIFSMREVIQKLRIDESFNHPHLPRTLYLLVKEFLLNIYSEDQITKEIEAALINVPITDNLQDDGIEENQYPSLLESMIFKNFALVSILSLGNF